MVINLRFADPVLDAYRLQAFLDAVIAQGLTKNRPPSIHSSEISWVTLTRIARLQYAYDHCKGDYQKLMSNLIFTWSSDESLDQEF